MNSKERQKMQRLEIENRELREMCDKHIGVYRDQAIELIEMRTKIELIQLALNGES